MPPLGDAQGSRNSLWLLGAAWSSHIAYRRILEASRNSQKNNEIFLAIRQTVSIFMLSPRAPGYYR